MKKFKEQKKVGYYPNETKIFEDDSEILIKYKRIKWTFMQMAKSAQATAPKTAKTFTHISGIFSKV